MNTEALLAEVERQVAERLPGILFEKGVIHHAKRSFRHGCFCSYCQLKREATAKIGTLPPDTFSTSHFWDYDERKEYRKELRRKVRVVYRAKLKAALES